MGLYEVEFAKHKESNMKELTDEQIDELGFTARIHLAAPGTGKQAEAARKLVRAAIAADRALNAEDHDTLEPKRLESIADPTLRAVCETYTNTPGGHFMRLQAIAKLVPAPADRDVMRQMLRSVERTHAGYMVAHDKSDAPSGSYSDGFTRGFGECVRLLRELAVAPTPPAEQQGEQESAPIFSRDALWGMKHALAELRAKVEALPNMTAYDRWCRKDAVLAEIDKLGGKV